jgi:hypothetical protein
MTGTTPFSRLTPWIAGASLSIATLAAAGQQPSVAVRGDDITIRGCVSRAQPGRGSFGPAPLLWTRGDIMLNNASAINAAQLTDRVFYWLDDDEDLAKHVGQMVEVKGDLGDFKKGEVEIDRDGDFTKIELKLGGKTEKVRVPTAWLGAPREEGDFDIVSRKIDVDKVSVIGACPSR